MSLRKPLRQFISAPGEIPCAELPYAPIVALLLASAVFPSAAVGQTLPAGFQQGAVFTGLTQPTAVKFASDGRVFVAEKSGLIKVFDNLSDPTPTVFADLRTNVHNFWDRGLLGLELHPNFPATQHVYVLYALDAPIGGTAPRWGVAGVTTDPCPTPPGATADGCVIGARLSRLTDSGNVVATTESEMVFLEDWCQQYPSHSIGSIAFGSDGALYVTGGDGASFNFADWGQDGAPLNPCGDPPTGVGGTQTPPSAEGGALRSQDLERVSDPTGFAGTVLRLDPLTGQALPDNPLYGGASADDDRIIAYGLRNPFRMTVRPGTNEVWVGDVGWNIWEEINRVVSPTDGTIENFGWPCYEGAGRQSGYDGANLSICESLYAGSSFGAVTAPFYTYNHSAKVVTNETCPTGSSAIAGLAFYGGGAYPAQYQGALFFADYTRDCIWAMLPAGRCAGPEQPADVRRRCLESRAAHHRARRRFVLRRSRWRPDHARSVQGTRCHRDRDANLRRRSADSHISLERRRPILTASRCCLPGTSTTTARSTTAASQRRPTPTLLPARSRHACG